MKIKFTRRVRNKLARLGFITLLDGRKWINKDIELELPCDLSNLDLSQSIKMGAYSYFSLNCKIYSPVEIGRFCSIGEEVMIGLNSHPVDRISTSPFFYAENWHKTQFTRAWNQYNHRDIIPYPEAALPVKIGDDVWIGTRAMIKGGVSIGYGAIIACGAVVTKDVKPWEIVGGVPAVKIGERKANDHNFIATNCHWDKLTYEDFLKYLPLKNKIKSMIKSF